MTWSAPVCEGFLLAATIAGDRHAAAGRRGLGHSAARAMAAMVGPLLGMSDVERRRQIQHISQRMAAPLRAVHGNLPPRALALLTPVAEPSLGSAWLQNAPPPRLGYRAERGLRRVLRAIAERGQWHA